ncbi:MAG: hypothetical protein FWF60_09430 [Oscillospiraceae bacterium]|nr:hypothetical protein [Oscillospiraceae bacterium]
MTKEEQREARKQENLRKQEAQKTPEGRYKNARGALIFVVVINVIFLAWTIGSSLSHGAGFPALDAALGGAFLVLIALCWALSKKTYAWMTTALVIFSIDTVLWTVNLVLSLGQNPAMIGSAFLRVMLWLFVFRGAKAVKELKAKEQQPGEPTQ